MGCCASKKTPPAALSPLQCSNHNHESHESNTEKAEKESGGFLIHRRRSHDRSEKKGSSPETGSSEPEISDPKSPASEAVARSMMAVAASGGVVRTSSCTKEEVDAILIRCGRLSRSSSGKDGVNHSGSRRSHEFDGEDGGSAEVDCDERRRRRRTASRSRERSGGGGRRVSRSPGRRSESLVTTPASGGGGAASSTGSVGSNDGSGKPGKMLAVPPTEKGGGGGSGAPVKRNAVSPRSRSPARSVQPSLSRSSSRKAEHSPHRRTPLNDLDINKANNSINTNKVKAAAEAPPPLVRSRSSRRSRDLDINVELLLNPKPAASYNSRILEDIHNFHQKTDSDTNQNTSTSVSKVSSAVGLECVNIRKKGGGDEPSMRGGEVCDDESSGSNSCSLGRASREPNSANSTDRWTSRSPTSLERQVASSNRGRESSNRTQTGQGKGRS